MSIKELKLKNFRNISKLDINLVDNINVFYGDNAQGKTNIVEAIYYLSNLKSFRTQNRENLIKNNCDFFSIEAYDNKNNQFKIVYSKDKKQKVLVNNTEIKKNIDYLDKISTIVFTPEDTNLFKNVPKNRRDFIDDVLSSLSPIYDLYLSEFNKLKFERNKLLEGEKLDETLLEIYTRSLATYILKIVNKRKFLTDKINEIIDSIYKEISDSNDSLSIVYETEFLNKNEEEIVEIVNSYLDIDKKKLQTTSGIHRDDFVCLLNNQNIDEFGSQGQNRLAVIALKIAIIQLFKELNNVDSIVILDDVLSELDLVRKNSLLKYLNNSDQLFITCTNKIKTNENILSFLIKEGKVIGGD